MRGSNKAVFAMLVVVVAIAAVLAGFGTQWLSRPPEVRLPSLEELGGEVPLPTDSERGGYVKVEVTPDTVQSVIATLNRPQSYGRTVTAESTWGTEQSAVTTARVFVDSGWTAVVETLPDGRILHSIVGDGRLYLWYEGDWTYYEGEADRTAADLAQRIPTYEDVLVIEKQLITDTRYEEKDGLACVCVEVRQAELNYLERYWVAERTGLLVAAETTKDGVLIYRMSGSEVEVPVPPGTEFALPDGTVLHTVGGG